MAKNVVGIDFGTSTSVIRVKEFTDSNEDSTMTCKPVTMSQDGQVNAPTLIRINGEQHTYGHNALIGKGKLYSNFKLLLRSNDEEERHLGAELVRDYYSYLFQQYDSQKSILFKDATAEIVTKVSYPPQWNKEQQNVVLQAAADAGFKNVVGVDEASASVNCVLNVKYEELQKAGLLKRDRPLPILIIDMGAGTTDIAFVKVTVTDRVDTEILGTWPAAESNKIYGGSKMDDRFAIFLKKWLTDSGVAETMADNIINSQAPQLKQWKEQTVSAVLEADGFVSDCSVIESIIDNVLAPLGIQVDSMPRLDRTSFEKIFAEEIEAFADVIASVPRDILQQTELVILTGGNSAWYWIPEVLCSSSIDLAEIMIEPWRILKMDLPNETVARGLVYPLIDIKKETPHIKMVHVPRVEPTCTTSGSVEYWKAEGNSAYYADKNGEKELSSENIIIPELGHNYEWIANETETRQVCNRCGAVGKIAKIVHQEKPQQTKQGKSPNIPHCYGDLVEEFITKVQQPPLNNAISELPNTFIRQIKEFFNVPETEDIIYTFPYGYSGSASYRKPSGRFYFTKTYLLTSRLKEYNLLGMTGLKYDTKMKIKWEEFLLMTITDGLNASWSLRLNGEHYMLTYSQTGSRSARDKWRYFYLDLQKYLIDNAYRIC